MRVLPAIAILLRLTIWFVWEGEFPSLLAGVLVISAPVGAVAVPALEGGVAAALAGAVGVSALAGATAGTDLQVIRRRRRCACTSGSGRCFCARGSDRWHRPAQVIRRCRRCVCASGSGRCFCARGGDRWHRPAQVLRRRRRCYPPEILTICRRFGSYSSKNSASPGGDQRKHGGRSHAGFISRLRKRSEQTPRCLP